MQSAANPKPPQPPAFAFILARALCGLAAVFALMVALPSQAQSRLQHPNYSAKSNSQAAPESRNANSAAPLEVAFQNGLLSVRAHGAPLSEVLRQVARSTGATLDLPPAAGADRIVASLGPAPVDQVLAALLNGSNYDYVLLNRADDPNALEAMILRRKTGAAPNGSGGQFADAQPQQQESTAYEQQEGIQPLPRRQMQSAFDQNQSDQEQPPTDQPEYEQPAGTQPGEAGGGDAQTPESQQPKTPEQLLEELRRLQQQQQQRNRQPQQPQSNPQQMDAFPPQDFPR